MRSQRVGLPIFSLGFFAFWINGDSRAVAPLLLDIAVDFGLTIDRTAILVTAYMFCFGFATLVFGPLGDRFGRRRVIKLTALGTALFSCLSAVMSELPGLVAVRALNGALAAGVLPVSMALVGESYPNRIARQNAIGKLMGLMFLGGASAMAIGGALAYLQSWRLVYGAYGVAELVLAILLVIQLRGGQQPSSRAAFVEPYRSVLRNKQLLITISVMFMAGFAVLGSFVFSGALVQHITGANVLVVGIVLSSFGAGTLAGGRMTIPLRRRLRSWFLLGVGVLGAGATSLLAATSSVVVVVGALFLFGVAFIAWQSTLVTTVQEMMPKRRGTAMSMASFAMVTSGGLGTWVNSLIVSRASLQAIYASSAAIMLCAGLLAHWFVQPEQAHGASVRESQPTDPALSAGAQRSH